MASCTQPTVLRRLLLACSEERVSGDPHAESIVTQDVGRDLGWHHDGMAGVVAPGDLLILREVTGAAGPVVQRLLEMRMAATTMTLPTCDSFATVWPAQMPGDHVGVADLAG